MSSYSGWGRAERALIAGCAESAFRAAELAVFSNAGNYRRDPTCPLIVPLVNPSHFDIIPYQRSLHSPPLHKGFIVTNANCSTTGLSIPLKALEDAFGPLELVMVTTMQAISGAGYPGVSSLDILDNVVPLIGGEEEKMEWELAKILGGISPDATAFDLHAHSPLTVSAACNRVPVLDGHLECASVRFLRADKPSVEEVKAALRNFTCEAQTVGCPSAPEQAIFVHDEPDRPQPRLDRYFQNGAGVSVGRVRECPVLDVKFVVLVNNVSIGAATSSIINVRSTPFSLLRRLSSRCEADLAPPPLFHDRPSMLWRRVSSYNNVLATCGRSDWESRGSCAVRLLASCDGRFKVHTCFRVRTRLGIPSLSSPSPKYLSPPSSLKVNGDGARRASTTRGGQTR